MDEGAAGRAGAAAIGGVVTVPVAMIAAVAANGIIGDHGRLPWRLPSDFAYFRAQTMGKPLLMGRKTFESIGRPLPGRTNIVITRQRGYQPDGVLVIDDLEAALEHGRNIAAADGAEEVMVAGGETIYRAAMPQADRLYITHVDLTPEGDARFPAIDPEEWVVVGEPEVPRSPKDGAAFSVRHYTRRRPLLR
jgi:dihydrofolate reductase